MFGSTYERKYKHTYKRTCKFGSTDSAYTSLGAYTSAYMSAHTSAHTSTDPENFITIFKMTNFISKPGMARNITPQITEPVVNGGLC